MLCDSRFFCAFEAVRCTTDDQARALGIEWCAHQCKELVEGGVKGIHFYTVGAVSNVCEVAKQIYYLLLSN